MNKKQNVKQETIASVLDITFEEPYTPPCMHSKSTKQKNSFMKDEDDDLDKTMLLNDIDSKVINLLDDDDDELDLKKTVAQISKGGDGVVDLTKEDNVPADTKVAVGKSLFIDVNRWKGLFDKADENDEPNIRKETKKNESTKRSVTELLSAKVKALYPKKSKKENQVVIEDDIIDEDEDNEEFEDDLKDEDYEEENPPEDDSEHEQDIESEEEDSIEVQKAMNAFNGIPFVKEIDFKRNPIEPAKCNAANLQHGSSSTSTAAPIVVVNYPSNWLFGHETKENKENIPKTRMTTAARKKAKLQEDTTKEAMSTHRLVQLSRNSAVFKEVEEMFIGKRTAYFKHIVVDTYLNCIVL